MIYLGFDPSIAHFGWAVVQVTKSEKEGNGDDFSLLSSWVIKPKVDGKYGRLKTIANELNEAIGSLPVAADFDCAAIVELPTFEKSARGVDLVKQKGLHKLCMATGVCIGILARWGIPYAMITANQWKRGTSKPAIKKRVEELFPEKKSKWAREDEWEAIGLALWGHARRGTYEIYS